MWDCAGGWTVFVTMFGDEVVNETLSDLTTSCWCLALNGSTIKIRLHDNLPNAIIPNAL